MAYVLVSFFYTGMRSFERTLNICDNLKKYATAVIWYEAGDFHDGTA